MLRFLVDEDLPRSLAIRLRAAGSPADDVRDVGLRGRPDGEVFAHGVAHGLTLLTADLGFANLLRFPLGTHRGIIVAHLPNEWTVGRINDAIVAALSTLPDAVGLGSLVIVEPGRIRLRRPG